MARTLTRLLVATVTLSGAVDESLAQSCGEWEVINDFGSGPLTVIEAGAGRALGSPPSGGEMLSICNAGYLVGLSRDPDLPPTIRDFAFGAGIWVVAGSQKLATSIDGKSWIAVEDPDLPLNSQYWGVVYGGSQFVAVGVEGGNRTLIVTSPDGVDWTLQDPGIEFGTFSDVTWGPPGYVVVGSEVLSSPDGITWTPRLAEPLNKVDFGNNAYVASDLLSNLFTSTDAAIWTPVDTGQFLFLREVFWTDPVFLAQGNWFGQESLLTSTNGSSWEVVENLNLWTVNPGCQLRDATSLRGTIYGSMACTTGPAIVTSDDLGLTWDFDRQLSQGIAPRYFDVIQVESIFVAVGINGGPGPSNSPRGIVAASVDGRTWSTVFIHPTLTRLEGLTWTGKELVVVSGDVVLRTPDLKNWSETVITDPLITDLVDIAWSDGRFVAVGGSCPGFCPNACQAVVATSSDAITWERASLSDPGIAILRSVAASDGGFAAVGSLQFACPGAPQDHPTIAHSPNGTDWSWEYNPGPGAVLVDVIPDGTGFVAAGFEGSDGLMVASADGTAWGRVGAGAFTDLKIFAVDKDDLGYAVVGESRRLPIVFGFVGESPDLASWDNEELFDTSRLDDVIHGNGQRVAVGEFITTNRGLSRAISDCGEGLLEIFSDNFWMGDLCAWSSSAP